MAERILVVDDDRAFQGMLVEALMEKGYAVDTASTAEEGIRKAAAVGPDLILHDIKLPGMSGLDALPHLAQAAPGVDVIVMTGYASKDSGVLAMQRGAYDYFTKPFSLVEMEVVVRRALEKRRLQQELVELRRRDKASPLHTIIGQSAPMRALKERVARVAGLNADVLIMGETGTGKELISDTIHALSSRSRGPFVKLNCAAIPENLIESELFGHEKGAFTGAAAAKAGKFEQARTGSILLDEIGDMPLNLQPKLLRAVEQKQAERLGGAKPVTFDVRIIAATNQELERRVESGAFRSDLYYRLNVATLVLPPLRQRKDDLPLLAEFFLDRANRRLGTDITAISQQAMEIFFNYDWPGNVRQFANAVERAAIFCTSTVITPGDVDQAFSNKRPAGTCDPCPDPPFGTVPSAIPAAVPNAIPSTAIPSAADALPLRQSLIRYERERIEAALVHARGVQTDAAESLGISPRNLWNKIQKHGIDPTAFKG